jgi:malate/lactate dehydrogenase
MYVGVPVVIGATGVERVMELEFNALGTRDVRQVP